MSSIICDRCGEFEEITARTVVLPFICQLCTKDSDLAIDRDVWETEYVGPACQQAAEEVHGLYEEADNISCDATTCYVVETRSKLNKSYSWFRSQNPDTNGVFYDYSTALEAAEREQDGSRIEYRVVEYRPEPTPCDAPYNSGVPCQSALDSVQADVYDQYAHNSDILDQFDEDTKLIDDLRLQLEQANLNVQILEETIEDLETQLTDLRLDICNVVFRTHF